MADRHAYCTRRNLQEQPQRPYDGEFSPASAPGLFRFPWEGELVADLKQRGMLDDTLVVWGGEFGRTPKAEAATCLEKSEKRGVQAARNAPSEDRKCWQRAELGIHGLNRWTETCLEKSEKRGVQADRNGPSPPPTSAGGPVARPEMSTADRLGSRERAAGATHFVAPILSLCKIHFH